MKNKIIVIVELNDMPYDKYEDGVGFIHATGRQIWFEDGYSEIEYEDYIYEDVARVYLTEDEFHRRYKKIKFL